jgi:diguanylate cyclase (GGDEF)-like protein
MPSSSPLPIELVDAFGAGVYLLMAITHADLWWHRRARPAHFWLALSACGALAVNLTGAINRRLNGAGEEWMLLMNALGVVAALVSIYELALAVRRQRSGPVVHVLQALLLLPVFLLPFWPHAALAPILYIASVLFLIAALVQAFRHAWSGDAESRVLTIGLIVLFLALIYDMLSELELIPRINGTPVLGFTVLYVAAARALSLRYDREHRELVDLRGELEARVQERTAALETANQELDRLSQTDPLTGLANRRSFIKSASPSVLATHALLMVDIDHFKQINDTHGHDAGDAVLRATARWLSTSIRPSEIVSRWGGEEFILLIDAHDALPRAEALRRTLAEHAVDIGASHIVVTACFGLSPAASTGTLDERLAAADQALYRAKHSGRNRVDIAD